MGDYTSVIAAVSAFLVCSLFGVPAIPILKKLKFGQTIREDGPKWHESKEGTPTMGGVLIIAGILVALVIAIGTGFMKNNSALADELKSNSMKTTFWVAGLFLALGMGLIGFMDDYIKVVKKRNLGLTARQKTFLQLLVSAGYLATLGLGGMSTTWIPFLGDVSVRSGMGIFFWPIALFFVYGFTNAVNLSDGIDGLATSITLIVCCAFLLYGGVRFFAGVNTLASAAAGACIGFVIWNAHPAKVFMGDTGSMFLGGLVVGLSFAVGRPIMLLFAGIVYLVEAFSVILQVAYYKRTKKRLFKMSPLHHHYEMTGWSEEKIVFVFSGVTLVGCLIALTPMFFNL